MISSGPKSAVGGYYSALMSVNLRLEFAMERCLSRMSCIGVRAAGKGNTMPIASVLRRSSPRGEKARGMVTSGAVRCQPMGRAVEGRIERVNGMRKKRRK
jgi:hypothetical protein